MYIWNRAEKVSEELMPSRIIECFAEWKSEEMAKFNNQKIIDKGETVTTTIMEGATVDCDEA